jgi:hypothetical protein
MSTDPLARFRGVLETLPSAVGGQMDESGSEPQPGSRAAAEFAELPRLEAPRTAYVQAGIALLAPGDHMCALERALTQPVMTFAPWSLARSVLEAASVASWLLDPDLDVKARISRSMTLRLSHLRHEATFVRVAQQQHPEAREQFSKAIPLVERRIRGLVTQAERLKLAVKLDKNNKPTAIGARMPTATDLAGLLGEGPLYRLFSAAAHGRTWAQLGLSLKRSGGKQAVSQHLTVEQALFAILNSVEWFSRPAWNYFMLWGFDLGRLSSALESAYDQLGLREERRFWRPQVS